VPDHGRAVLGRTHDVDVAHRLTPAPQRVGRLQPQHPRNLAQRCAQFLRDGRRRAQPRPSGRSRQELDPLLDVLDRLGPEPLQVGQLAGRNRRLQIIERADVALFPEHCGLFGAQSGDAQQLQQRGRNLAFQLLDRGHPAMLQKLVDLLGDSRSDARNARQFAAPCDVADVNGQVLDAPRRATVSVDAERILAADLHQVRVLFEHLDHVRIGVHARILPRCGARLRPARRGCRTATGQTVP